MNAVPSALRERLGEPATAGLLELLNHTRREWADDVLGVSTDRYERRLTEESSLLRVEMGQGFAAVREEMANQRASLREEIGAQGAALRREITEQTSALRQEMTEMGSSLRQEMNTLGSSLRQETAALRQDLADQRFELFKWAFLFWIGQFFAVAGLVAVLVRALRGT